MEDKEAIRGANQGAKASVLTPKIVAELPQDRNVKEPEEAAKTDGYPGSCQI